MSEHKRIPQICTRAVGPVSTKSIEDLFKEWVYNLEFWTEIEDGKLYLSVSSNLSSAFRLSSGRAQVANHTIDNVLAAAREAMGDFMRNMPLNQLWLNEPMKLYPGQRRYYDGVVRFIKTYGRSPTNMEICAFMNVPAKHRRSKSYMALKSLVDRRALFKDPITKTYKPLSHLSAE